MIHRDSVILCLLVGDSAPKVLAGVYHNDRCGGSMYRLPSLILMGVGVVFATGCAGGGESASQPSEQTGFQRDAGRAGLRLDSGVPSMPDATMDSGIDGPMTDMAPAVMMEDAEVQMPTGDPAAGSWRIALQSAATPIAHRRAAAQHQRTQRPCMMQFACGSANACNARAADTTPMPCNALCC